MTYPSEPTPTEAQTTPARPAAARRWTLWLEVALIVAWAFWAGRELLDFNEAMWPLGREYTMAVSTHHFWNDVRACGQCALWNGAQLGGYPALANTYAGILHPLLAIPTLLWGVINGSKVIIVLALAIAGLAQWWLARELGLGWLARLWSGLLAVVAGTLVGKLELGLVSMTLSIAVSSLLFPAVLRLYNRRTTGAALLLAAVIASALLSGQGYIQFGLVMTIPALLILLLNENWQLNPLWKSYGLAAGLAALLAGVFLVPLLANWGAVTKDLMLDFTSVQPLGYNLLNYMIDDLDFHKAEILLKPGAPNLYIAYIGWLPLFLAVLGLGLHPKADRTRLFYLAAAWLLIVLPLDREFLNRLGEYSDFIRQLRFPNYIFSIATPALLGMAAYGLDQLQKRIPWPTLTLTAPATESRPARTTTFSLLLILLLPLAYNLRGAYTFAHNFLLLREEVSVNDKLDYMEGQLGDSHEWIAYPLSEHFWTERTVARGFKVSAYVLPFYTHDKTFPSPYLEFRRDLLPDPAPDSEIILEIDGGFIYRHPSNVYAAVWNGEDYTPCTASGWGGSISVSCSTTQPGTLIVKENYFPAWQASRNGQPMELPADRWLTTDLPAGQHTVEFTYRPWDVWVGLALSLVGVLACLWLGLRRPKPQPGDPGPDA